ncbi:hypothetical protein J5N97_017608 [Dioscorea zingiberensis]|uniref:Uncharacterized protein n=1 Tax=Dioscorea zingiberensis TaxID=325984 RepID=A0A9D5CLH8_9LILI|nr:hypothetical protein J5N97_017608 [Dioscorea zingiberensis]
MPSTSLSYQKLKKISSNSEEEVVARRRRWLKPRRRWRRPRVRVAGLRRILRKKANVVRAAVKKVVRRLKEGRPCIGELFAGNYMFMQVSPSPTTLACLEKSFFAAHHHAIIPPPSSKSLKP